MATKISKAQFVAPKGQALFRCQECGRGFRTVTAAERATNEGCPGCGGSDIDMA